MVAAELARNSIASEPEPGQGLALSPGEQERATKMVALTLRAQSYLHAINGRLAGADESLPAIGVVLGTVPDTDLPEVFISYGRTEPNEGLRPVTEILLDGRGGREVKYGLALPMDRATQRSVTFWPSENGAPSQTTGWWQQWRSNLFTMHKPDEPAHVREYPSNGIDFGDMPFSTWPVPGMLDLPTNPIIDDSNFAQEEARRAMTVVRRQPGIWADLQSRSDYNLRQHFVVLGQDAVGAALNTLQEQPEDIAKLPQPLIDMLDTVADDLAVTQ